MAILAATLLLAGCSSPAPPDTTTTATDLPLPLPLGMAGCQGFHTFFPSPAELFVEFVPENFTLATSSPGTVDIPVFAYDCGNATAEMWVLLPVTPPEEFRNESFAVDAVVLQALTTNATLFANYAAWGFDVASASVREAEYFAGGVAGTDRIALGDGTLRYDVRTTTQTDGSAFAETHYRYWATNGTKAIGWLDVQAPASTSVGVGTASFQSEGDAAAPPATVGIGHRVGDAALVLAWHEME